MARRTRERQTARNPLTCGIAAQAALLCAQVADFTGAEMKKPALEGGLFISHCGERKTRCRRLQDWKPG